MILWMRREKGQEARLMWGKPQRLCRRTGLLLGKGIRPERVRPPSPQRLVFHEFVSVYNVMRRFGVSFKREILFTYIQGMTPVDRPASTQLRESLLISHPAGSRAQSVLLLTGH